MLVITGGQDKAVLAEAGGSSLNHPSSVYNVVVTTIDVIAVMPHVPGRVLRNVHPSSQLIPSTAHQVGTIILLLRPRRLREGNYLAKAPQVGSEGTGNGTSGDRSPGRACPR